METYVLDKNFESIYHPIVGRVVYVYERLISLTLKFSNLTFPLRIAFHLPLQPIRCVGRTNLAQGEPWSRRYKKRGQH